VGAATGIGIDPFVVDPKWSSPRLHCTPAPAVLRRIKARPLEKAWVLARLCALLFGLSQTAQPADSLSP
jgi:hypothetical protein